jgi:stage II sporulation protein AA (anti-sigma F factor antagonist)
MLQIQHQVLDNTLVVTVAGELDLETAPRLRVLVDAELAHSGARNLLLDLAAVSFLDSSGLGAILGRYRTVAAAGGKMGIAGATTPVKRVLRLSGVAQIVSLFNTRETGLRSMSRQRRGKPAKRSRQAAVSGVVGNVC